MTSLGQAQCKSPEEFKAWSQNLGHESVLTTFYSYGEVQEGRQAEIFKRFGEPVAKDVASPNVQELARAIAVEMKAAILHLQRIDLLIQVILKDFDR